MILLKLLTAYLWIGVIFASFAAYKLRHDQRFPKTAFINTAFLWPYTLYFYVKDVLERRLS